MEKRMQDGYFYIITRHESTGEINGVPGECGGIVFMGPCKPRLRAKVKKWDWIIGISSAKIRPRRILSIIEVGEKIKFAEACKKYPQAIWSKENKRGQIYCKPLRQRSDGTWEYEPVKGSSHKCKKLKRI